MPDHDELAELRNDLAAACETLRWYADLDNWEELFQFPPGRTRPYGWMLRDHTSIERAVRTLREVRRSKL